MRELLLLLSLNRRFFHLDHEFLLLAAQWHLHMLSEGLLLQINLSLIVWLLRGFFGIDTLNNRDSRTQLAWAWLFCDWVRFRGLLFTICYRALRMWGSRTWHAIHRHWRWDSLRRCGWLSELNTIICVVMMMVVVMVFECDFLILELYHNRLVYHNWSSIMRLNHLMFSLGVRPVAVVLLLISRACFIVVGRGSTLASGCTPSTKHGLVKDLV